MLSNAFDAVRTFFGMRGARIVKCPETHQLAAVDIDALHAGWTTLRNGTQIRVRNCSRWPEKSGCAQACVRQIEAAPAECGVKSVLTKWYENKRCAICKEPFSTVDWQHARPALIRGDGTIGDWCEFRPSQIAGVLQTHLPVCWNCAVEETFRNQHPELFD
jgi:hypothetical protein